MNDCIVRFGIVAKDICIDQIALDDCYASTEFVKFVGRGGGITDEGCDAVAAGEGVGDDVGSESTCCAGEEDLHCGKWVRNGRLIGSLKVNLLTTEEN